MNVAEQISIKNFLNAFFRENPAVEFQYENEQLFAYYLLQPFQFKLCVQVTYYSLTGRHQYAWPITLWKNAREKPEILHPFGMLGLIMQDLMHRHPKAQSGHREFIQRFYNSCENIEVILKHLSPAKLAELFSTTVEFQLAEGGLLAGHQMHPAPKSREGFSKAEFKHYSPELQHAFQLHYFLAQPHIIFTDSDLANDANTLVRTHFLTETIKSPGIVLPLHPWQARFIQDIPCIAHWLKSGILIDLGKQGREFVATSSVRTLYCKESPYMVKTSLNVAITNSVRMQYAKELTRGIAAHRFWHSTIGQAVCRQFPRFTPLTDPAFLCLQDAGVMIHETATLFRINPFVGNNNTTSLAALCQDYPGKQGNRFNNLIALIAQNKNLSLEKAAKYWFEQFIHVVIEPILWLYVHYGVAVEAHQQNLLVELQEGVPIKSFYRDNQGYYFVDDMIDQEPLDKMIVSEFCHGTEEFITHHFIYYLICNSVFGIINALGTSGVIVENKLLKMFAEFIAERKQHWQSRTRILDQLLQLDKLPFKGNLLTRFHELDELVAPLEQQSVYIEIDNPIKNA